ncbi:MAG: hypothetical protein GX946_02460 [Oligosphaeraceae bacterium]|nr:hypothetical protein [Oligosphaeraceae bacterium]
MKYPNFIALDAASSFATYNEGILIIDELDPDKLQVDPNYNGSSGSYGYAGLLDAVVTANPKVSGPTKARILYWNENPEGWFETPGNATWGSDLNNKPKIALFIPDDNNGNDDIDLVLASSQGYKFSFNIKIRTPYADADNVIKNQVEVTYAKDSSGNEVIAESNESRVTVGTDPDTATPGVAIGPFTYPLADTEATFTNLSHPAITKTLTVETGSLDTTRAGIRDAGEVVAFPLSILNPNQDLTALGLNGTGGPATSADIYNITYSAPPAGYTIVLYKSDAITPLADTNGDGIPDTGAIEPGAQADIVVKVYIAASLNDSTAREFTITAQSTNAAAPAIIDTTTLHIQQVLPAGVDIATATPVSAGPPPTGQLGGNDNATDPNLASEADDDDHTTIAGVNPGTIVVFPVDIANMRPGTTDSTTSVADTYKLSVEKKLVNGKDAGPFIVELLEDIDNNKEVDANELVPISDTGWLAPVKKVDTVANVYADAERIFRLNVRVKVPEGTTAGNYIIAVKATSTNNPNVEDIMHLLVKVNEFPSIQVTPDNTATVVAGGTYIFSHVVVNTGNIADKVTMEYNIASTLSGYNAVWVNESGAILGDGSTYTTENNLDPNDSFNVYLKVFVPANAPAGSVVPITVTGTMDVNGTVYDTALDVLTVIDGALQLTKSNSPTGEIEPGKKITYTTVYKNLSPGELTDAYIADAIPANTYLDGSNLAEITATLPGASTSISVNSNAEDFEYILNGGSIWTPFDLGSLPDFTEVTNIRVKIGTVPAGEKGDFVFKVIVK